MSSLSLMHCTCQRPSLSWLLEACQLRLIWSCLRPRTYTVPDGSISFMSSLSFIHCTVPASVHLFHDLPQLDSRDVLCLSASISFMSSLDALSYLPACTSFMTSGSLIAVIYYALQRPSLLWALLAWCTAYLPASISFMTSRSLPTPPDLEPTRDLPARGLLSSKLNVLQAVKQKLHLTKKIELNTKQTNKRAATYLTRNKKYSFFLYWTETLHDKQTQLWEIRDLNLKRLCSKIVQIKLDNPTRPSSY